MSNVAIRVENLGKMYRIGGKQEKYSTLRDTLVDLAAAPFRKVRGLLRGESASGLQEEIWALKDVSFEVKHGEVVGIIGRNGAGKSTLLKILSRITEPTTGYADVYGRVGALLEVGTGFHPELTGRENVYLNGAILGMTRRDIDRKFDEIVDFAGIEKFIDTPVKHYSSGMGLRLGFAVAAHLEPEILVVDEVLAVGDAEFQKKCLGKMQDVAGEGRTVLFVSHNMDAILSLCASAYVLTDGRIDYTGAALDAVDFYLHKVGGSPNKQENSSLLFENADKSACNCVTKIELLDPDLQPKNTVQTWDDIVFRIHYTMDSDVANGSIVLDIRDMRNGRLIVLDSGPKVPLMQGENYADCVVPQLPLSSGEFFLTIGLTVGRSEWISRQEQVALFQVLAKDVFDLGRPPLTNRMLIAVKHTWRQPQGIVMEVSQ